MTHPIVGWESSDPVPEAHQFNRYLQAKNGRLHFEDLDLANLFLEGDQQGFSHIMPSPLEIVYLPLIGRQIAFMNQVFAEVRKLGITAVFTTPTPPKPTPPKKSSAPRSTPEPTMKCLPRSTSISPAS